MPVHAQDRASISANKLAEAAIGGDILQMQKLLTAGANVNTQDGNYGFTALIMASGEGYIDTVELLLQAGANVNTKDDDYGYTPLMMASIQGHDDVVTLLKQAGAK